MWLWLKSWKYYKLNFDLNMSNWTHVYQLTPNSITWVAKEKNMTNIQKDMKTQNRKKENSKIKSWETKSNLTELPRINSKKNAPFDKEAAWKKLEDSKNQANLHQRIVRN